MLLLVTKQILHVVAEQHRNNGYTRSGKNARFPAVVLCRRMGYKYSGTSGDDSITSRVVWGPIRNAQEKEANKDQLFTVFVGGVLEHMAGIRQRDY